MKTMKINKKLSLNKESIALLNDEEMNQTPGGAPPIISYNIPCHETLDITCVICDPSSFC